MPSDHPTTAITIRPEENASTRPIAGITKERSVLQAVTFNFSQAKEAIKGRSEIKERAGVYFLWAEPWGGSGVIDADSQPADDKLAGLRYLYVGSSQNLAKRLSTWAADDWWQHAIVFSTANREIDGEQATYVEELLIKRASQLNKAKLKNDKWNDWPKSVEPASSLLDADMGRKDKADYFYREILVTLPLLGLDSLVSSDTEAGVEADFSNAGERFYLSLFGGEVEAEGEPRDDGFMVFQGARARKNPTPGFTDQFAAAVYREKLIQQGVLATEKGELILGQDNLFPSASSAASVLAGSSNSGPKVWKSAKGESLKSVIENELSVSGSA